MAQQPGSAQPSSRQHVTRVGVLDNRLEQRYLPDMGSAKLRMTTTTWKVLDVLVGASPEDPMFGLRICDRAELGSGTVYPVLDRLERVGWVSRRWESEQPIGRPKRCYYTVTDTGRTGYEQAVAERAARRSRRVGPPIAQETT